MRSFFIRGLRRFKEFPVISTFRKLVEDWYVSDFRIDAVRDRQEVEYGDQLSRTGDNLAMVAKYIRDEYPEVFSDILEIMLLPTKQSLEIILLLSIIGLLQMLM